MLAVKNRTALLPVLLSDGQDDFECPALYAAKELRWFLGRITGAVFTIKKDEGEEGFRLILDASMPADDFTIKGLTVTGGVRGVIYGVYEFLESLGCRFFTKDCEKIPVIPDLDIPYMEKSGSPRFEYREHNYTDASQSPRFAVRCRLNGASSPIPERMGGNMRYGWFVHSFKHMLPTAEFGESHPEYYALVDGKRVTTDDRRTQLCLTNPDVLRIAKERVRKRLLEKPGTRIISVSQNDWGGNCECPACRKVDKEEGSPAGTLLRFVNAIAESLESEFPDVIFDTLAYQYTRPAPQITRNRKNVCVRLCSIECCFAHPYDECTDLSRAPIRQDGTPARFIDDLRDWGKVCDRLYIWDYVTCFGHYPMPYANWRVLQKNLIMLSENNVKGVFEQGCYCSRGSTDFNELRMYLIGKLLWDPYCDVNRHRAEFMEEYYGAAAPFLTRYLDLLCDISEKSGEHIHFDNSPEVTYLNEENLDRYDALFAQALDAVRSDPVRLMRVEKARLSLRWVRLKRKAMLKNEYNPAEIEAFTKDWRAFGLSRIDEWYNLESTHRALLDGIWRATPYFDHWTGEEPEVL